MNPLESFLHDASLRHILVVGDLMLDRYLWGSVDRISPEAPVPILKLGSSDSRPGGAANVALNFAGLGCRTSVFGFTGDDSNASTLIDLMEAANISSSGVVTLPGTPTTTKTRVIAGNQHLLRVDDEVVARPASEIRNELVGRLARTLEEDRPDAVVLQDYNKGVLDEWTINEVISKAQKLEIPVTVDPKSLNFFAFTGATIFKPNLRELDAQCPFDVRANLESLNQASEYVRRQMSVDYICVTLSEHGIYIDAEDQRSIYPTASRDVVDVCGAGDAVISVLTLALLRSMPVGRMAQLANATGGMVCDHVGVSPVTGDMLRNELAVESFS